MSMEHSFSYLKEKFSDDIKLRKLQYSGAFRYSFAFNSQPITLYVKQCLLFGTHINNLKTMTNHSEINSVTLEYER